MYVPKNHIADISLIRFRTCEDYAGKQAGNAIVGAACVRSLADVTFIERLAASSANSWKPELRFLACSLKRIQNRIETYVIASDREIDKRDLNSSLTA